MISTEFEEEVYPGVCLFYDLSDRGVVAPCCTTECKDIPKESYHLQNESGEKKAKSLSCRWQI